MSETQPLAEYLPPLYPAVGELVVNWSLAELAIVEITAILYHLAGGRHMKSPALKLPWGFKKHKEFQRLCAIRITSLSPFAGEIRAVLDLATPLARVRDGIVHGAISQYDPATGVYTFNRLDRDNQDDIHIENKMTARLPDFAIAAVKCQELARQAITLSGSLLEAFK